MLFDDPDHQETIASVLVPVAVAGAYTYKVPPGKTVVPGTIVKVPLGPREVIGAVWDIEPDAAINPKKLKTISRVYDTTP
ncbi:MAG: primosomal protein N', partial [Roseibium sp.]